MSVTVWPSTGAPRVVAEADGADIDGIFVRLTAVDRRESNSLTRRVVLTLRARDVDCVEIDVDGIVTRMVVPKT
jgi:hypothetical protein